MSSTLEEIRAALVEAGMPEPVIAAVEEKTADETVKAKYLTASALLQEQKAVIIYGNDAPQKDVVCAKLLRRYMVKNDKTGRWLTPAHVPTDIDSLKGAGVLALVGTDLLLPQQAKVVAHAIRDWLPRGRAFILSISSPDALKNTLGVDMANYLSHAAAAVEIEFAPAKQFK